MIFSHRASLRPWERRSGSFFWDSILGKALPEKGKILSEWRRAYLHPSSFLCASSACLQNACICPWAKMAATAVGLVSNHHCHCFRDEYFRMKVQWKSVSEEQEMRNSLLRGYRSLIGQFCWRWRMFVFVHEFVLSVLQIVSFLSCLYLCRAGRKPDRSAQHVFLWEWQPRPGAATRCPHDLLHVQLRSG